MFLPGNSDDKYLGLTVVDFVFMYPVIAGALADHKDADESPINFEEIMYGDVKGAILSLTKELGVDEWWPMEADGTPIVLRHQITNSSYYHEYLESCLAVLEGNDDGADDDDISLGEDDGDEE